MFLPFQKDFIPARDAVIAAEFAILSMLGFELEIPHPITCYKKIITALGMRKCGCPHIGRCLSSGICVTML